MIRDIIKGKSLGRILMNKYCKKYLGELRGEIIDFGSGENSSYLKYFNNNAKIIKTDLNIDKKPDLIVNLNRRIEKKDNSFDNVILFNTIYILDNPDFSLREINRILKPRGKFFLTIPLIFNEAPEPVDYWRFTSQGIKKILKESGFKNIELYKIGERFSSAVYLINPFRKLKYLNLFLYPVSLFFDKILPVKIKNNYPCPLGYFIICKK